MFVVGQDGHPEAGEEGVHYAEPGPLARSGAVDQDDGPEGARAERRPERRRQPDVAVQEGNLPVHEDAGPDGPALGLARFADRQTRDGSSGVPDALGDPAIALKTSGVSEDANHLI